MMIEFLRKFVVWLIIFTSIDFLWLGLVAKKFYDEGLKNFERTINWPAAMLTYLLIGLGIIYFVLPLSKDKPAFYSFFIGAAYGLVVYGVYDFTNLATLRDWSVTMVIVDILWGMLICGTTSLILKLIFK